ncbi:SDR family oxidoreductase [Pseudomonas sp. GD03842]|uniref:SDR family NAD(P)-dependent oxidoreductase n=1 Tax=unclassified Pseudomonas TaxID=196821 RepID=UPI000D3527F4|nr:MULTISPECIES: SDR family oxidoreductase [unclassified Pseudomonas]MDH0749597.1 SDR family oxidoreductase [Pseudomonas sp. GD03842]RAU47321.1 SDR family NAD(P)-dependent oxidoreductase [Pseudomonas sp. RIT 409]RAU52005.1 SDR family NAD(P)-dependent oxidoreductase [Pseudomonas sp. RIT 412]
MRKIVITGAANGIGRATTLACIEAGYFVIAADKDRHGLRALQDVAAPNRLETHLVDFSRAEVYRHFIGNLYKHHSTLHGLVNNAGLYHGKSVYDYDDQEIEEIWTVNLKSLVYLSKDFALHESQALHTRSIINITSVAGEVGSMDALYGATKAGVIGLTKANAWNFAPRVRVNAVSPALVRNTSIYHRIPPHRCEEYQRQEIIEDPLKPEGVADVIMFLLSDQSRHLTGKVIPVDNGAYPR